MTLKPRTWGRYVLAVGAVAAGFGLYRGLSVWVGPGLPTFITFYPAVMVAALVGGFGPGLLATALAALVVDYWIQEPRGLLIVHSLRDSVALALFCCMGVFISTVAHLYQRARGKAAAYDQEQALREAHERLALAQRSAGAGMWDWDMRTETLEWSPELFHLFGLDPAQAQASFETWRRILHPADREAAEERIRGAVQNHVRLENEYRIVLASGEERWINSLGNTVYDAAGRPLRMSGICVDITERKQAEAALRESEERLRLAAETADIGFYDWNTRTGETYLSKQWKKQLGYEEHEVPNRLEEFETRLHPDERERVLAHVREYLARPYPNYELEFRLRHHDGSYRTIFTRATLLPDATGARCRMIGTHLDITEGKRAEEELRRNRARLSWVLEHTGVGLWLNPLPLGVLDWDAQTRRLFFVAREAEPTVDLFWSRIHPDDREQTRLAVETAIRDRTLYAIDHRVVNPATGEIRWIRSTGQATYAADGTPTRFDGINYDITERKLAEAALRESEWFYRQTLESIPGMVFTTRPDGYCDYQSQQWVDYTGIPMAEHRGDGWNKLLHPDDRRRAFAAWREAVEGRAPYDIEYRVRRHDGAYEWFKVRGRPIRDAAGQIVRWFGTALNINDLVVAEAALRKAHDELEQRVQERTAELQQTNEQLRREIEVRRHTEQELIEAELRYRTVAEFTHDWEYWETPGYGLRYCSPSCERITGYSAREFVADPSLVRRIVYPEDADIWQKHQQETLASPGPQTVQFRIRRKDGAIRWVEHACQPVLGEDGVFLGTRAGNRDITDRKEEEFQTQQLREELAHVTRVTTAGQLAASLAHELNQPLTAIHCNAETAEQLLATDPPDVAEVRETLADIAHDSERASGVIQRLRALCKKTGRQQGALQLNEVIEETLGLLRSELAFNGASVRLELAPELPVVRGDRIELQQVLLNLVVNALHAMAALPPATRRLLIRTECENPDVIRACLQDSGTGIAEEQLGRLFEPFFTTKATGMGMGLTICQSIIESHGGRLWAVNNPDCGATFQFTLPIHHGKPA